MRIFKELGISSQGKVLSYDEFLAKGDWANFAISEEKVEDIIKRAEGYLEEEIPMLTLSMYHDFFVSGSRQPFVAQHIKRRDILVYLALAEHHERSGRFMSKLCDALWAILEETTWVIPAHIGHNPTANGAEYPPVYNETALHGVDLYAANTGSALSLVMLLLRKELSEISPILTERTEYEIEKRIIRPFISFHHSYTGEYGKKCNNWVTHVVECVLFTVGVCEKRQHVREAVVRRSMGYLDNYMAWMPEDGGCDEGPGYWSGAGASYFTALEELYDLTDGAVNVFDNQIIRNMGEFIYKFNINGRRYVNFADCSPNVSPDGYLIKRYGERCGSEGMVAFGKMLIAEENTPAVHYSLSYRTIRNLATKRLTEATVTKAERFVWYPDLKVMISRESEDTSKGMFLAIKGGHNKQSHNHNDVGSYIVYKNGNPVVIDPGNTTYVRDTFGPNRYNIWSMQSHYHNLPAFDGKGEHQGDVFRSVREVYDEDSHKLTLGLELAFERDAGVESYTRSAVLDGGVATVGEDILLDCEREIDFRLITVAEPTVIEEGRLGMPESVELCYDKRLSYSCEEFDPVGNSSVEKWGTEKLYRLHFTIRAKELKCEFVFK
ncbi:MAG: heparinase II/III family protein [Clostridia bacterium]|nr:heparinase II/III family protein [Clostridia bacterium]